MKDGQAPRPAPRAPMVWWDSGFQADLHQRLEAECWRRGFRKEVEDLVAEAVLRVHVRILAAPGTEPIHDPVALAMIVLHGVIVDGLRRGRMLNHADPDSVEAAKRHGGPFVPEWVPPEWRSRFRGRIQKAVVAAVCHGQSFRSVAAMLGVSVKEVRRVAAKICRQISQGG